MFTGWPSFPDSDRGQEAKYIWGEGHLNQAKSRQAKVCLWHKENPIRRFTTTKQSHMFSAFVDKENVSRTMKSCRSAAGSKWRHRCGISGFVRNWTQLLNSQSGSRKGIFWCSTETWQPVWWVNSLDKWEKGLLPIRSTIQLGFWVVEFYWSEI